MSQNKKTGIEIKSNSLLPLNKSNSKMWKQN